MGCHTDRLHTVFQISRHWSRVDRTVSRTGSCSMMTRGNMTSGRKANSCTTACGPYVEYRYVEYGADTMRPKKRYE